MKMLIDNSKSWKYEFPFLNILNMNVHWFTWCTLPQFCTTQNGYTWFYNCNYMSNLGIYSLKNVNKFVIYIFHFGYV
jgi:hypothetical protein